MLVEDQFEARMKPHPLINLINVMLLEKSGAILQVRHSSTRRI